jgi:hypothetical protein
VNKLKQYDKRVYVVGGRAFTSTILQKNCHEFISYESLLMDAPKQVRSPSPQPQMQNAPQNLPSERRGQRRPPPLELAQAMPLVERALQVLERREVRPQLGLLKSTMLQLDSTFSEKAYGSGSFTDFVEKLQKADMVDVTGGEGRYMIKRKGETAGEPTPAAAKPEESLPVLRDVLETHRLEVDNGAAADDLAAWVKEEQPDFDWKKYGFQEFGEMLNYAQDKSVVRIEPDAEKGLMVYLGAEFHPPAMPEPVPDVLSDNRGPTANSSHQGAAAEEKSGGCRRQRASRRPPAQPLTERLRFYAAHQKCAVGSASIDHAIAFSARLTSSSAAHRAV